jgi:hypothetical protein
MQMLKLIEFLLFVALHKEEHEQDVGSPAFLSSDSDPVTEAQLEEADRETLKRLKSILEFDPSSL